MESFCSYLLAEIQEEIANNINYRKMESREKYLISAKWMRWTSRVYHINMISLAYRIANSFICTKREMNGQYVIQIDPKLYMYNSKTKLSTVARFLDKGNEKVRGTWFISSVLNRYTRNINRYWYAYASRKLGRIRVSKMVIVE